MAGKPKVVILCGGMGMRLREETEFVPKPLVPIGGRPILWHIMKLYAHRGFTSFVLCLGYKGEMIRDYFTRNNSEGWNIVMADTGEKTNTGGRIKRIEKHIAEDEFMATYGDGVSDIDISALLAFHRKHGKICTMTGVHPWSKYGRVAANEDGLVTSFVEKPILKDRINGGFFVFKRNFFDYLGPNDVLEHTPFTRLVEERQMMLYKHDGFWHCLDTFKDKMELEDMWKGGKPGWKVWRG